MSGTNKDNLDVTNFKALDENWVKIESSIYVFNRIVITSIVMQYSTIQEL